MSDRPSSVGSMLHATPPDRLPEAAAGLLRRDHGAQVAEVLIADLRLTGLWPLLDRSGPPGGPLAVRCFASQRPVTEAGPDGTTTLHLPISAWGERVGVLVVETGEPVDGELTGRFASIAAELAVALLAAGYSTDRYRRAQRRQRLTMAAELQWDLLPGRALSDDRFRLAGQLEPAYDVHGDHFDWAIDGDLLTVTVLDGFGDGMAASLLTTTAVTAMRNARRSGANLIEQAGLASDAVFAQHAGKAHAATLLLEIDLADGRVEAVDAGSPKAMIARDGEVLPIELDQQLPLGMFSDTRYEIQEFQLEPGDRLLVVSDGVHTAAPGGRSAFGTAGLPGALRNTRLQPAAEAVATVMRTLHEYHAGADPQDDAVTVCLDWRP